MFMLDCFMFFGAPFEICDPTLVHSEPLPRGASTDAQPVWLTPFFSQPSVLPRPQLLSFDNHLDCLCLVLVFFTSAISLFLAPRAFFEGCTLAHSLPERATHLLISQQLPHSLPKHRGVPLRARSFGPLARRRCAGIQSSQQHRGILVIHRHVFHNDKLFPVEDCRLSPGQAGLICGWGLFTTIRIFKGEAFGYERHWRRLEKDAAIIRLPMPYSGPKVRVHLQEVIRANKVSDGCGRIYLIYNQVSAWRSEETMPQVDLVIYTASLPEYKEPIRLAVRQHGRHAASALAGVKTISWLPNVWAVAEAQKEGFDEVVLLNERGEVAECTAANIFLVKGEKVFTPPLSSGCLEGVTRGILMEIAPEAGISVVEQTLKPEDFAGADEVFITSTNRNLLGVAEIGGQKIPIAPGPITRRLDELFDFYVTEYVSRRLASAAR